MTDVCNASTDPLKKPLSPARGNDHPPSPADLTEPNRCREAKSVGITDDKDITEEAKAAAIRAPARVKRATGNTTDVLRALENRHRWLLFAQHCYTCARSEDQCELGKLCTYGKKTLKHVAHCKREDCPYPRCRLLKPLLQHSRRCQSPTCAICVPVWNYIQKDTLQLCQQPLEQQQQPQLQQQQTLQQPPSSRTITGSAAAASPAGPVVAAAAHTGTVAAAGTTPTVGVGAGTERDGVGTWSPALGSTQPTSAIAPGHSSRPDGNGGPSARGDKAEGGASSTGGIGAGRSAVGSVAPATPPDVPDSRRSTTGAVCMPGVVGSAIGPNGTRMHTVRSDGGLGKLAIRDHRSDSGPEAQESQGRGLQQQQTQQQLPGTASGAPAAGAGGASASAPSSLAPHRYVGVASGSLPSPYNLPPYIGGLSTTAIGGGGVQPGPADQPERLKGITITATPARPIPVANCPAMPQAPVAAAVPPHLVHSYPPSSSLSSFFPHLPHHHPHPHQTQTAGSGGAAAAVAAHWLPLQGVPTHPVNGASPSLTGGGGGGSSGVLGHGNVGGGTAGPMAATLWTNPTAVRSGPVALYGISPDVVRGGHVAATAAPAPPTGLQTIERFPHPYAIAGVNGAGGVSAAGTALTMAGAPLLLWPTGHPPPSTAATAPPPQPVAASQGAQIPLQYTVAQTGPGGASAPLSLGPAAPTAAAGLPQPPALIQAAQVPAHHMLYGHPSLASAPGAPGGAGAPAPASLGAEVTGAGLWGYVLR